MKDVSARLVGDLERVKTVTSVFVDTIYSEGGMAGFPSEKRARLANPYCKSALLDCKDFVIGLSKIANKARSEQDDGKEYIVVDARHIKAEVREHFNALSRILDDVFDFPTSLVAKTIADIDPDVLNWRPGNGIASEYVSREFKHVAYMALERMRAHLAQDAIKVRVLASRRPTESVSNEDGNASEESDEPTTTVDSAEEATASLSNEETTEEKNVEAPAA